jgi:hypothetical protein
VTTKVSADIHTYMFPSQLPQLLSIFRTTFIIIAI